MAPIVNSIEIARSPDEVFAYLGELDKHPEWQEQLLTVDVQTEGPTRAGTRAFETRKVGGRTNKGTIEITEYEAPRRVSFRGLDGPIRPVGTVLVEPLDDGSRSRLTLEMDLEGHGIGKLLMPLARRQATKQIPKDQAQLKGRLESGAPN
jgi:uncharacterized membrane protein